MSEIQYYTKQGLESLKQQLDYLTTVERSRISQMIAEARDKGDLSENAEYDAAKEQQGLLELKISKLQNLLLNARIIDDVDIDVHQVSLFTTVKLKNIKTGAITSYSIVPESEANLKAGKISVTSPIAKGLLGHKSKEEVAVKVPAGTLHFQILEITR
ncbi:MAG TPA: transcription elongation factor GreA [Bacteroidales bacterium]|jgi:transcription elongation factor GreA|nr:transcription elongation factor GreA [Bacteroidales bacterium]MDI9574799.1 transcription elongation factor GreA [Bacteroidota bacterium]OQC59259.1 MAG: Transcription elongation factor GreA [Bacteroidetes bacterium ADurb.Bin012]MBP9512323.1 transcription elongation factor GreA [Bacteroidales bacterium]MBP9588745.1 transcription elongation factor GreA [Bacteroidales bacterium]